MVAPPDDLRTGDGLLIVDVQNDFCPGGALAVADGDQIIPVLNQWIDAAREQGLPIYASRDWHPRRHPSFREQGGDWPPHCLQDTEGARFHPALRLTPDVVVVTKGVRFDQDQYSVFDQTGFGKLLVHDQVRRLYVGGLAQDVCVRATVLDARRTGIEVVLLAAATRPVDAPAGEEAIEEMREAGAVIVDR
jgi:nicotinamidase/pyrazinamidase